jgi:AhpC/TSA family
VLALPVTRGDEPKGKDGAKEQYAALVKEFSAKQQEILAEARKAKGEEQQKLFGKLDTVGRGFADRFYKLAEDYPKDPVGADALFWIVQSASGSQVHSKAAEKVTALIGEMPLQDLLARLKTLRGANPTFVAAILKRTEKEEKDPRTGDLVAWIATNSYYTPEGAKAVAQLIEKYPDNPAIERVCAILGRGGIANADALLQQILAKSDKPKVKAAAALAIGQALASKTDGLGDKPAEADKVAAEGEKYLAMAIDLYGKENEAQRNSAEAELRALRTLRVGRPAPEIKAGDLDGKDFKLSDYRGKVVLLDFWGNW